MAEYIDRKKLLEELSQAPAYFDNGDIRYGIDIAFREVLKQPLEDVVSVARCKDCVYRINEVISKVDNLVYWPCRKHGIKVLLTDYCSSGNNIKIK